VYLFSIEKTDNPKETKIISPFQTLNLPPNISSMKEFDFEENGEKYIFFSSTLGFIYMYEFKQNSFTLKKKWFIDKRVSQNKLQI
jgi:hypothetical protein